MLIKKVLVLFSIMFILCISASIQVTLKTNVHKSFLAIDPEITLGNISITARPNSFPSESLYLNLSNGNGNANANSSLEAHAGPNSLANLSSTSIIGTSPSSTFSATKTTSTLSGGSGGISYSTASSSNSHSSVSNSGSVLGSRPLEYSNLNLANTNTGNPINTDNSNERSNNINNNRPYNDIGSIVNTNRDNNNSNTIPTNEIVIGTYLNTNIENNNSNNEISNENNVNSNMNITNNANNITPTNNISIENNANTNTNSNTSNDNRHSSNISSENPNGLQGHENLSNTSTNPLQDTHVRSDGRHPTAFASIDATQSNNANASLNFSSNTNKINTENFSQSIDNSQNIQTSAILLSTDVVAKTDNDMSGSIQQQDNSRLEVKYLEYSVFPYIPPKFSKYFLRKIYPNWNPIYIPEENIIDLKAGPNGTIYIINKNINLNIYDRWRNKYIKMNEKFFVKKVAVASDGTPYVIDINERLFYLTKNGMWSMLLECVNEVTIGIQGEVFISDCLSNEVYQLYCTSTNDLTILKNFHLNELSYCEMINLNSQEAIKLEVLSSGNPIMISKSWQILYYYKGKWLPFLGLYAFDMSVPNKGMLTIVSKEGSIYLIDYLSDPINIYKLTGQALLITTDHNSMTYILDSNKKIYSTILLTSN